MQDPLTVRPLVDRSLRRAKLLTALLFLCLLLDVCAVGTGFLELDLWQRVARGSPVSEEEVEAKELLYGGVGILQTLLFIATGVVWLFWLHAAYKVLTRIGSRETRFSPGWAVGYWFIPVVNLVRPYQVVKDLWARSRLRNDAATVAGEPTPALVSLWWGAWILSSIVGRLFFRQSLRAETVSELIASTKSGLVTDASSALAAALALVLVRRIFRFQNAWSVEPFSEGDFVGTPSASFSAER